MLNCMKQPRRYEFAQDNCDDNHDNRNYIEKLYNTLISSRLSWLSLISIVNYRLPLGYRYIDLRGLHRFYFLPHFFLNKDRYEV
jgi:hypothetical protein